jgi:hypothetical protein
MFDSATPDPWASVEHWGSQGALPYQCLLELRTRVEQLEANSQPTPNSLPIRSSLSPAAQAVLNASKGAKYDDQLVADILRAAADQIEELYCDEDIEDSPGVVFALRQLMLIAAELQAE